MGLILLVKDRKFEHVSKQMKDVEKKWDGWEKERRVTWGKDGDAKPGHDHGEHFADAETKDVCAY